MTASKLQQKILATLKFRKDIWIDPAVQTDEGGPDIRGIQLRRLLEMEVRGAQSYHPYTYTGWKYYGQAFAIETDFVASRKPLTKEQELWRDGFELAGGLYIEARNLSDVVEALGTKEPEPWTDYENRVTKIPLK